MEHPESAAESTFRFQVNLGGMLDILSNHLYKSPDVFLRELLQNGIDAITLRKKRQPGQRCPAGMERRAHHHLPHPWGKAGAAG